MKRKVYLETSVISYLTARPSKNIIEAGHQHSTYLFWDQRDDYDPLDFGCVYPYSPPPKS